jgi:hypothetical protein
VAYIKDQAQQAAYQAQIAAQQAATGVNGRLRASTLAARGWVAPRLEGAADYTTSTVAPALSGALCNNLAPRVSGALRSTARQVSPQDLRPSRSPLRAILAWSALAAAVLAGAGAAGTLAWRRYRAAMDSDTEPDMMLHRDGKLHNFVKRHSDAKRHGADGSVGGTEPTSNVTITTSTTGNPAGDRDDAEPATPRPSSSSW